jgi:hypothetical protein
MNVKGSINFLDVISERKRASCRAARSLVRKRRRLQRLQTNECLMRLMRLRHIFIKLDWTVAKNVRNLYLPPSLSLCGHVLPGGG